MCVPLFSSNTLFYNRTPSIHPVKGCRIASCMYLKKKQVKPPRTESAQ